MHDAAIAVADIGHWRSDVDAIGSGADHEVIGQPSAGGLRVARSIPAKRNRIAVNRLAQIGGRCGHGVEDTAIGSINLRNAVTPAITSCEQNIEIAIVIIVAPGHGTGTNPAQAGANIAKNAAGILIGFSDGVIPSIISREQNVEIAVVVIVPPSHGAKVNSSQPGANIAKDASGILIDFGDGVTPAIHSREQNVEIAVVVIVTPGRGTVINPGQAGVNVGE